MKSGERTTTLAAQAFQEEPELKEAADALPRTQELLQQTRTADIDGQTLHIVEGDLLFDEDQLRLYALRQEAIRNAELVGVSPLGFSQATSLVAVAPGGQIVRWRPGKQLTYCVLRRSFLNQTQYDRVCEDMGTATKAWQETCGIEFEHLSRLDDHEDLSADPDQIDPTLVFTVRFIDAGGQFIASAFFPTYPPARRRVLVDPSFFSPTMGFDTAGVLRHELGHVMGFRHEHIRSGAPPVCPDEPLYDTVELGDYDPQSVMHYFCGNVGNRALEISELDREGARSVYGPAFSSLMLID